MNAPNILERGCSSISECNELTLLIIEESIDYAWSNFLEDKLELKNVMFGLLKNFNNKNGIQVKNAHCNNAMLTLNELANKNE